MAATSEGDSKLTHLLSAISLFKGDFLPKSSTELWAVPITTYYHNLFLNSVHEAVELLNNEARFDEIIEICQQAVAIDPFDEQLTLHDTDADGQRYAAACHQPLYKGHGALPGQVRH
jgi:DNA-binding SARP family transcriptional activator